MVLKRRDKRRKGSGDDERSESTGYVKGGEWERKGSPRLRNGVGVEKVVGEGMGE